MEDQSKFELQNQLDLGLKEPFSNRFWSVLYKIRRYTYRVESFKFFKDYVIWTLLALNLLIVLLSVNYFNNIHSSLPSQIPLLQNYSIMDLKLVSSTLFFIIPLLAVITFAATFIISLFEYNKKSIVSYTALSISLLCVFTYLRIIISIGSIYL